jgi:hypothetical protein
MSSSLFGAVAQVPFYLPNPEQKGSLKIRHGDACAFAEGKNYLYSPPTDGPWACAEVASESHLGVSHNSELQNLNLTSTSLHHTTRLGTTSTTPLSPPTKISPSKDLFRSSSPSSCPLLALILHNTHLLVLFTANPRSPCHLCCSGSSILTSLPV